MRLALLLASLGTLLALAACGADGTPVRPTGSVGVGVGSDGAFGTAGLGVTGGTFSLGLSL
jgi:hypothetical protein